MARKKKLNGYFDFFNLPEYANAKKLKAKKPEQILFPEKRQLEIAQIGAKEHPKYGLRVRIGRVYEFLGIAIFGGVHHESFSLNDEIDCEPDATLKTSRKIVHYERKSIAPGGYLRVSDEQMAKYCLSQYGKGRYKAPELRFQIFRHGIKKLESNYLKTLFEKEGIDKLVKELAEKTLWMIDLPFSIIEYAYRNQIPGVTSRYNGKIDEEAEKSLEAMSKEGGVLEKSVAYKYVPCLKISSGILDRLVVSPEDTIKKFGLAPDSFLFYKRKSDENIKIDGNRFLQFPILIIRDRDYRGWLEGFKRRIFEDLNNARMSENPKPMPAFMFDILNRQEKKRREQEDLEKKQAELFDKTIEKRVKEIGDFFEEMAKKDKLGEQ